MQSSRHNSKTKAELKLYVDLKRSPDASSNSHFDSLNILQIGSQTVVCSRHFKKDDFKWTPVRKTLKKESIPSLFVWNSNEKSARREIFKHPIPEKMPRLSTEENNNQDSFENANFNVER
jgi:hypothetical protein